MSQKVISFHYTVKDTSGNVLDSSQQGEPMSFLTGQNQIIPGLEAELVKMSEGETKNVLVESQDAYGPRQDNLTQDVPRSELPQDISVGQMFSVSTDDSGEPTHLVTVVDFDDEKVTLDANHPLAGQDLAFEVSVEGLRDATESEVEHGHVHDS